MRRLRGSPAIVRSDGDEVSGDRLDPFLLEGEGAGSGSYVFKVGPLAVGRWR